MLFQDIFNQKLIFTIPILVCAFVIWRKMTKQNKNLSIEEFSFRKPIHKISTSYLKKIFQKLSKSNTNYHLINISENEQLYLVNNQHLIESIQFETTRFNGLFESQLIQPYLVLNSECNQKLTHNEFETYVIPKLDSLFQLSKNFYLNQIIPNCFENFISKLIKQSETHSKKLESKDLFELVFRVSDRLVKRIFLNLIYDDADEFSTDNSGKNTIHIMDILYKMHERFTLGLFTKQTNVNEYSRMYLEFLKLIDFEFQLSESDFTNVTDSIRLRFLLIKCIYLDVIRIFSCLLWIINDAFKSNNQITTKTIRNYLIKTTLFDLYHVTDYDEDELNKSLLNDFKFINNKNALIALNLFSVKQEDVSSFKCNDFILSTLECLVEKLQDRIQVKHTQFSKSNDLKLINFNEIKMFEVEIN